MRWELAVRVEYHLDRDDRIVAVNDDWTTFALANSGPTLAGDAVLGQSIWDHIADPGTASIYDRLYRQIRATSRTASFTFRCDAPHERRLFRMQLAPAGEGAIVAQVNEVFVVHREPIQVLDRGVERGDAMVRMCAWCHAIATDDGAWLALEDAVRELQLFHAADAPRVTHTVCPRCRKSLEAEIDGFAAR